MALRDSAIFLINILLGISIGNLFAYEVHHPMRGSMPRGIPIPIRPLDRSTIHKIARRPAELNPDSETIFFPINHQANYRPLQIMERISVPVDHREKMENFNILNFDAYIMKPTNNVTLKPVTERKLHIINQTDDDRDDARPSSSIHHRYRTKDASKKPKKSTHMYQIKEFDDLEFYRAFLEHQKHAAMVKRLKPKSEPSSRLPIGIDFFEHKMKNKIQPFPPITYTPLYLNNNLHRSHHHEDVEASNVQNVRIRHPNMLKNQEIRFGLGTTPLTPIHTTVVMPVESKKEIYTVQPRNEPDQIHRLSNNHLASEPEMYKFTIDDVVIKPNSIGVVNNPFSGPVTLSPPSMHYQNKQNSYMMKNDHLHKDHIVPASANAINENHSDAHYRAQINYPPKMIYSRNGYRHIIDKNFPIEASASSQQRVHKYSIEPIVLTTKMTFAAETEPSVASTMKASNENNSKHNDNRNKKRRPNTERHRPEHLRMHSDEKDQTNNLEFSNSYTKRRTQGYNSEEDIATTPIIPSKLKNTKNHYETKEQESTTIKIEPNNEKIKYFQDTFTEQLTPHQIDTGHLSENPSSWEERYERKNLKSQRFQGKMKWGDRKGNFGEHYYDLNHHNRRGVRQSNHTKTE